MVGKSEEQGQTDKQPLSDGLFLRARNSPEQGGERSPEDPGTGGVQRIILSTLWMTWGTITGLGVSVKAYKKRFAAKWASHGQGGHHHKPVEGKHLTMPIRDVIKFSKERAKQASENSRLGKRVNTKSAAPVLFSEA